MGHGEIASRETWVHGLCLLDAGRFDLADLGHCSLLVAKGEAMKISDRWLANLRLALAVLGLLSGFTATTAGEWRLAHASLLLLFMALVIHVELLARWVARIRDHVEHPPEVPHE